MKKMRNTEVAKDSKTFQCNMLIKNKKYINMN